MTAHYVFIAWFFCACEGWGQHRNVTLPAGPPAADAVYGAPDDDGAQSPLVDGLDGAAGHALGGGVILRRNGEADAFFPALEYSETGRGQALRMALTAAQLTPLVPATVELRRGRFAVAGNVTLLSANPAKNCKVRFGQDAAIVYADPEDAATDYLFFDGTRNVLNFGALPSFTAPGTVDNLAYF